MKPIELPPMVAAAQVQGTIRWERRDDGWWCINDDLGIESGYVTVTCQWFLQCENDAVTTRDHPILGSVPICQRCDDKVEALS